MDILARTSDYEPYMTNIVVLQSGHASTNFAFFRVNYPHKRAFT
jgi:hypothetical protein